MMLRLAHLRTRRQQLVEMAAPACRIFAMAIAAHGGPIEHGFDAAAQPVCGLRLLRPERLDHLHHQRDVDRV